MVGKIPGVPVNASVLANVAYMYTYIPGRHSFDVEILEADKYTLSVGAVEEIMALGVSRIKTGEVRRREATVG